MLNWTFIPTNYLQKDVEKLEQILQMCRDAQMEYCIIEVPLSDTIQRTTAFSHAYADVMKKVENGEQVETLFYRSYQEMLQNFPYTN